jgi:hypothetical protein
MVLEVTISPSGGFMYGVAVVTTTTSYVWTCRGEKTMDKCPPLMKLEAEIVELEETILDLATRDRLLDMPKKLFSEAQEYRRKGNAEEARLTLNSACRLVEPAKRELKK